MTKLRIISKTNLISIEKNGYAVIKDFLSENEVYKFKKFIIKQFKECEWNQVKTFGENYSNYCTSWLFNKLNYISARLYIQEHCRPDFLSKKIDDLKHDMLFIEKKINSKTNLEEENLRTFFDIVSIYGNSCSGYPPHKDINRDYKELQAQQTLTKKSIDFNGGDLVLHFKDKKIFTLKKFNLSNKDIVVFDKSIIHSVEQIKPAKTKIGRWMILYNASIINKSRENKLRKFNSLKESIERNFLVRLRNKIARNYINKLGKYL